MAERKWFKIGEVATMRVAEGATERRAWSGAPAGRESRPAEARRG
jgi:hypothetical protein